MRPYYSQDGISIYHGNCLELDFWLSADCLLTDPPYGMDYCSGWSGSSVEADGDTSARDRALELWGDKPALVFGRWSAPRPRGTRVRLVWDKGDWPGMGDLKLPWGPSDEEVYVLGHGFVGARMGTVMRCTRMGAALQSHPTEKPVELLERLVSNLPAGVIADPFMGSGSTLDAARRMGRSAIGVEVNEKYCENAANRLSQRAFQFEA